MTKYKTILDKETGELKKVDMNQPKEDDKPAQTQLTEEQLQELEGMTQVQLINLIRLVSKAGWGYGGLTGTELIKAALMSKDEAYEALKLTALVFAYNAKDWREYHAMATFWADREKGKPQQSVDVTGKIGIIEIVMEAAKLRNLEKPLLDITPNINL